MRILALGSLLVVSASTLHAQCADGTPPPCGARVVAKVATALPPAAQRARRYLVLPFRNVTRQADQEWLVEGSTTMLSDALGRWQGISVVSDERLYPALKRAGIAPGSVVEATRVRKISEETGGWTAISGEVLASGGRVRVTARAWDVATDKELVRASSEVAAGADVRVAFDSVGLSLLRAAGLENASTDLAGTTTRNVDAYRAYLRGIAHQRRGEVSSALTAYTEAIKADSAFALAWMRLSLTQSATEPAASFTPGNKAAAYAARAVALAAALPPRQRQLVSAIDAQFRAQFSDARKALEGLVAADSTDVEAIEQLVGLEMFDPILVPVKGGMRPRGSTMRAARLAKRIVEIDPSRNQMYGVLASIYSQGGVANSNPAIGVVRAPASLPDLMQSLQQRENFRIYMNVYADTMALVPAESLSFIPKDSLTATRKRARAVARAWGERWLTTAGSAAAPHQLMAELYTLDGEYDAALRVVTRAESLGVKTPTWVAPARRLYILSKKGDFTVASRLADSLSKAAFFANPNNLLYNGDAAAWAFALNLLERKLPEAGALLDQTMGLIRALNPQNPSPTSEAFGRLIGNEEPEEEPGISREFRGRQLDSILAHVVEYRSAEKLGAWIPLIAPMLAEAASPKAMRSADVLKAADKLATAGQRAAAYDLAYNMIQADSSAAVPAAAYPWFKAGADALNATRAARAARFKPSTATISADRAVFEWIVDDASPFTWHAAETPILGREYRWEVRLAAGNRQNRLVVGAAPKQVGEAPASGTLEQLLPQTATRVVFAGALDAKGVATDTTQLQGVTVRTEFAAGVFRMVLTDPTVLAELRRTKPADALFFFTPCVRPVGVIAIGECPNTRVPISYK